MGLSVLSAQAVPRHAAPQPPTPPSTEARWRCAFAPRAAAPCAAARATLPLVGATWAPLRPTRAPRIGAVVRRAVGAAWEGAVPAVCAARTRCAFSGGTARGTRRLARPHAAHGMLLRCWRGRRGARACAWPCAGSSFLRRWSAFVVWAAWRIFQGLVLGIDGTGNGPGAHMLWSNRSVSPKKDIRLCQGRETKPVVC